MNKSDTCQTAAVRKAECAHCGGDRNCDIKAEYSENFSDETHFYSAITTWYILKCRGCDHVFVQTVSTNSEDLEHEYLEDGSGDFTTTAIETVSYWPSLAKRSRPEWISKYGIDAQDTQELGLILLELYSALDNDLTVLSVNGIRTAYDIASQLLGVDPSLTFAEKLDALVDGKHIGSLDKDRIATMVDAGSAAAHRGWRPKQSELKTLMDILEHFISEAFIEPAKRKNLNEEAAKVKASVPPRARKSSKGSTKGESGNTSSGAD
jgi:hypothetical protein